MIFVLHRLTNIHSGNNLWQKVFLLRLYLNGIGLCSNNEGSTFSVRPRGALFLWGNKMDCSILYQLKITYSSINKLIIDTSKHPTINAIFPNVKNISQSLLCTDIIEFVIKIVGNTNFSQNIVYIINYICDQNFDVAELMEFAEQKNKDNQNVPIPFSILILCSAENHVLRNRFWNDTAVFQELSLLKSLASAIANINNHCDDTIVTQSNKYIEYIGRYALSKLYNLFEYKLSR